MQNKTKLALAGGVATLIALGVAGAAQADWSGYPGSRWGMQGMGPGMRFMAHQLMERYDTNKDGKISQDEIDNNRAEWLARFDTDKDGALSLKEFEALWMEAHRLQMVREFQFFDKDGDAKVTLDEYKGPLAHLVRDYDRNGDGFLSKDDRPEGSKRWQDRGGGEGPNGYDQDPDNQQQ
jgi:Ca2+-binding EF-hand superfamily protein